MLKYISMINVVDEISTLKRVLVKRPGQEIGILNNTNKEEYLFDEIPDLKVAQKEHDIFTNILRQEGVKVDYLEDLMTEVLKDKKVKEEFLKEFLNDQNCSDDQIYQELLNIKNEKELVDKTMSGFDGKLIAMPNLYFTRDPFTIIGNHIALYHMHTTIRNREVIYGKYINKYHKDFGLPILYMRNDEFQIEGGDVMLLNNETMIIGISERTVIDAACKLAKNIIDSSLSIKQILFMEIPSKRACMHLDTVFTRFDKNKFVVFDEVYQIMKLSLFDKNGITQINDSLTITLNKLLNATDVKIITCGNKDNEVIEQWNDACNTLCIAPNKFIVYDINATTNEKYLNEGATIYKIPSKELLKGRGGPHCMSMALKRSID